MKLSDYSQCLFVYNRLDLITFFDLKKTEFINEHKKIELETKQKFTSNQLKLLGKISLLNELLEDLK